MRVLVACEESQTVTAAFRARGHEAYSCDIQHCALWNHMEWHIVEDARKLINGNCTFQTVSGGIHTIDGPWDLLIAHPPCTYLSRCTAMLLFSADHSVKNRARLDKGWEAKAFFMACLGSNAKRKAIESPVPLKIWGLPPWSQIIEPYMFGDPWRKKTCLWLENLPALRPDNQVEPKGLWVGTTRSRNSKYYLNGNRNAQKRAKTFTGIARAMAEQWE